MVRFVVYLTTLYNQLRLTFEWNVRIIANISSQAIEEKVSEIVSWHAVTLEGFRKS